MPNIPRAFIEPPQNSWADNMIAPEKVWGPWVSEALVTPAAELVKLGQDTWYMAQQVNHVFHAVRE